ncbi:acyl-coenzyme A synthetase/AMP-(fatty) acid ligase [Stenotrophomonas maltophilia]|uniref:AMP-binding protein n=1 Tax=Stenotrophomonas chelatiphaga TaxID=517011 RepID=UPI000F4BC699|nr:AMP-binding protein [Stenotrophomonas chelatiphaga]MCS4230746.1 acyl-CoA synthetase (AMP-forming)/AMP-acid ligase II [Stenotrophomonas chelatiphaga]ROQ40240.1 acyl-coenzyme A synthetase/AMP-(fatty) acid ligase [Stenotrophomonas maltophilia]
MSEWIPLHLLLQSARPGRTVGALDGAVLDHAGLLARARGWQAAFAAAEGRDWALYFTDSVAFAAALLGAWSAGKRVHLPGDDLPGTLQALRPHVDGFAGDVDACWQPLHAAPPTDAPPVGVVLDPQACRLVVFTSGSTGEPAAIEKRLDQLGSEVEALQQAFGALLAGAHVHGTVSHQHIYGLLFRVLWPLAAGRAIERRRFFHEDLVAALAAAPSVLVATPAHLKRMPPQLDWAGARGQLRAVFSSGGPLPAQAAAEVRAVLGIAPIEVFGSSETGGIAWRRCEDAAPAWQPLPGVQWRIDDGQLTVASAHLAQDGWWRSEDRAEASADGGFRLLGRADRIVKIEERRVSLGALEQALCRDAGVAEAQVMVLPGARAQLAAVIVPHDRALAQAGDAERRAFIGRLTARLAEGHDAVTRPRRWRLVAAMPVNAQGKPTQALLQALFQKALPTPQWLARDATTARLALLLAPELMAFEGHFPGVAVLPGVAQVDWAIQLAREAFDLPPRFLRMDALKFQQVARPHDVLQLHLDWDPVRCVLGFRFSSDHGIHASGKVLFADAD